MAFKIYRSKKIIEDIDLTDELGEITKTVSVNIDVDSIASNFRRCYFDVLQLEKQLQTVDNDKQSQLIENYGNAVISLFNLVFGEENTDEFLAFFENHYTEMVTQLCPFIVTIVIPAIENVVKSRKKELSQKYNRKDRRRMEN